MFRIRLMVMQRFLRSLRGHAGLLLQGGAKDERLYRLQHLCGETEQTLGRCLALTNALSRNHMM